MTEEWKSIEGYEGLYEVSNLGKVRSLEREFVKSNGRRAYFPERILCQFYRGGGRRKYWAVKLCRMGIEKTCSVHILVAKVYVEGYFIGAQVNHIDGNKLNNASYNLEWTDNSGNQKHAYSTGLNKWTESRIQMFRERVSGANSKRSIPLINTSTGERYVSIRAAAKESGIDENKLYAWVTGRNRNKSSFILDTCSKVK